MSQYYGVYRVWSDGSHRYVPRTATTNKKLATEIARDLTYGEVTMPDGSIKHVPAHPHIAKEIH